MGGERREGRGEERGEGRGKEGTEKEGRGKGREGKGGRKGEGKGRGKREGDAPLTQIPGSAPAFGTEKVWLPKLGSHTILVFFHTKRHGNIPTETPRTGRRMQRVWKKITIFDQYLALSRKSRKIEP